MASGRPIVLVAHSLGCHLVASWSALSRHTAKVRAALLVAPPDTERDDLAPQLFGWRPISRTRLPFQALLLASSDDPFCDLPRAQEMTTDWGCRFQCAGPRGHLNAQSGLGDWPEGLALIAGLVDEPSA